MPELAEVEYYRRQWNVGIGEKVLSLQINPGSRNFRDCDTDALERYLPNSKLLQSKAHGKRMVFQFSGNIWMGVHLGMTGELFVGSPGDAKVKHEHLILVQKKRRLIYKDPRQFGAIRFHRGTDSPAWWSHLQPAILSDDFTRDLLSEFLKRRKKSPIKAVLLMQERFPGIGNWLADEILWRARIRPACPAGRIKGIKLTHLFQSIKGVCEDAMRIIAPDWGKPPDNWLFLHRWTNNGICPKSKKPLVRETIGGRTTCWSPAWQCWPKDPD